MEYKTEAWADPAGRGHAFNDASDASVAADDKSSIADNIESDQVAAWLQRDVAPRAASSSDVFENAWFSQFS